MRRGWCAVAMVTCAAMLGVPTGARGQEIGPAFDVSLLPATRAAVGMAGDGSFVVVWQGGAPSPPDRIWARRFDAAAQPQGPLFQVNAPAPFTQAKPAVAVAPGGEFTVVWSNSGYGGWQVRGRRFDAGGAPVGQEFAANTVTSGSQTDPTVAVDAAGNTVVAWTRSFGFFGQLSDGARVFARRFDAAGAPMGGEFRVNTYTSGHQQTASVAFQDDGGFVVAWHGTAQDGSAEGVFAQRYAASGTPVGGEFPVNTYTTGIQAFTCVGPAGNGGFVIGWVSESGFDDAGAGIFARQYDAAGVPSGPEFRVSDTPVRFVQHACSLSADGRGGYAISWAGDFDKVHIRRYDAAGSPVGPAVTATGQLLTSSSSVKSTVLAGNGAGRLALVWVEALGVLQARGRVFGAAWPLALAVDESPSASDRNGVLAPGEAVVVAPSWYNTSAASLPLSGQATSFTGPGAPSNPSYLIFDANAGYGTLTAGGARSCTSNADCYILGLSTPSPRPQKHMDATFVEQLSNQQSRTWGLHVGGSFDDVPRLDPFYRFTETLLHHGVSAGCTATSFCPGAAATREQMAVFLLVSKIGRVYSPPRPAMGVFTDVPATSPFAPWIEDLWSREIVSGCEVDKYCPSAPVTRAQMAVMLLRSVEGPSYLPPACITPAFADVPCSDPFARWINELVARGITAGCGGGLYCPASPVTRGQMSVFLSRGFALALYGPGDVR